MDSKSMRNTQSSLSKIKLRNNAPYFLLLYETGNYVQFVNIFPFTLHVTSNNDSMENLCRQQQ